MAEVTLRKDEVTRVLVVCSTEKPELYGPLMQGWITRPSAKHATYSLGAEERAFVARCLPQRTDLGGGT